MGKTITLCGPAGAGHALKALNNYLSAAGLVAMCEALVVGEAFGLDPGTMVDVFNSSTGKSNATEVKGRQFVVLAQLRGGLHHRADGQGPAHRGRGRDPSQAQHAQPASRRSPTGPTPTASSARAPTTPRSSATPRGSPRRRSDEQGLHARYRPTSTCAPTTAPTTLKIGRRFWATIEKRTDLGDGRLMGTTTQIGRLGALGIATSGGDEVLVMLSGEMDIVLETGKGERPDEAQGRPGVRRATRRLAPRPRRASPAC